jgi:LPXTG-motif cell wall-anchored protein
VLRKLAALATIVAASVVAPVGSAHADDYSPKIPTQTRIQVVVGDPGEPITIKVGASANYPTPPEGDIAVRISGQGSSARAAQSATSAPLFSTTVHFVDKTISIEGPRLPKGTYLGTAHLTPDDGGLFLPSSDTTEFRVGAVPGGQGGDNNGNLPNTGGPNVLWLLLGGGLLVAGAGGVGFGRRRSDPAAA